MDKANIYLIAAGESSRKDLLRTIQSTVKITRSMSLECIELANSRLFFPSGGTSLWALIYYTRISFGGIRNA